ncbi:MAG: hypothetical protein R3C59_08935 [Planctomycetaceae bacterium]
MMTTTPLEMNLSTHGFVVAYRDDEVNEIVFVRKRMGEAFDRVRLNFSDNEKAASAGVEISIVPGRTALKSLCVHRCLIEVATDAERGISQIHDDASLRALFARISEVAPSKCDILARDELARLLQETSAGRNAATKYLKLIEEFGVDTIVDRVTTSAQTEIARIQQHRFVCIPNGEDYYSLALQAIAVGCGQIEGDENWLVGRDADTSADRELMIRLQIMASRLAVETGWELQVA